VKDNYIKEMKQYIEEQLASTMNDLGYPEDIRYLNILSLMLMLVAKRYFSNKLTTLLQRAGMPWVVMA